MYYYYINLGIINECKYIYIHGAGAYLYIHTQNNTRTTIIIEIE